MEKFNTYALAAMGVAKGIFEVYAKPAAKDVIGWAASRAIQFSVPTQEQVDDHIHKVAHDTQTDFKP